ncbi:ATP-dependent RNA helicase dbp6 [Gaeumannomyces tritici R3-111a-1]|uniref:ATP-dependent RNA helicase n=1 Tax=Gaeumannomyces tritici (strain R3-111a-1) TaxID=644352 RepID=J3PCK8_GAET3|nr:ATP-dependent RNA helicase dbp6 [Gaeumannomyces tritici R3-111a-1]EJT71978.1 ATP-dependent RNA helicase dbp6 [Gaeumannomyces tritici R3-111a-1]
MYARYVPPARDKASSAEATQSTAAPSTGATTPQAQAPYARYTPSLPKPQPATAVLGATPQPRKIVFNYGDDGPAATPTPKSKLTPYNSSVVGGEDDEPRRKKAKHPAKPDETSDKAPNSAKSKRKPVKDGVKDGGEEPSRLKEKKKRKSEPKDYAAQIEEDARSPKPEKRERKNKKERAKLADQGDGDGDVKMRDQPDVEEDEADTDPVDSRHKSVLKKKELALRRARNAPVEADEPDGPLAHLEHDGSGVHGLEPLPQPAFAVLDTSEPTYDTLPPWLGNPIHVSQSTRADWTTLGLKPELGISTEIASFLESKGYEKAFAVQTAVIPRLLPTPARQGDLVISAATGSGKTLAYVLPMIRDVSLGSVTKLRALIVVPTRELVRQVHEVCIICAAAYARQPGRKAVKIGTAVGNQAFKREQESLVDEELRYDPRGYQSIVEARKWDNLRKRELEELEFDLLDLVDKPLPLVNHVVDVVSKVDILICTPGRLVEHIGRTPGFDLSYVRWLVVDEADKLLEQSYQQWLDVVMEKLAVEFPGARDFPLQNKSGVRKVILSATMTRNVSLLSKLRLRRPELIVLEGGEINGAPAESSSYELALPELLQESAIKIRDPEQKPMYLIDLLTGEYMRSGICQTESGKMPRAKADVETADESSDDSDDPDSSDTSSSGSESDASDTSPSGSDSDSDLSPADDTMDTVLIFTKSNETALRLSRLLEIMAPSRLASRIGTLTSTTRTSERKKVLRAFHSAKLRVLVASDLVARGLDLPNLDHVVNYDMPPSVRAYVHRVGRTARAGRPGRAWTFFTKTEAGWFFAEVASQQAGKRIGNAGGSSGPSIARSRRVETVKITARRSAEDMEGGVRGDFSEARVTEYENALESLGKEAKELREK